MGLYDRVIYPGRCEGCGRKLTEFQTQDTKNPAVLCVPLKKVKYFYTVCTCGTQTHYKRDGRTFKQYSILPKKLRDTHGMAHPAYPDG